MLNRLLITTLIFFSSLGLPLASIAAEAKREPPPTRRPSAESERIYEIFNEARNLPRDQQLETLKVELYDPMYKDRFERMNNFEKSVMLSFYVQYHLHFKNWTDVRRALELILLIDGLKEDVYMRTQKALEQLDGRI